MSRMTMPGASALLRLCLAVFAVALAASAAVAAPAISSFSPAYGTIGTSVTLKGSGFTGASAVAFNGVKAAGYVVVSDTVITATVPTGVSDGRVAVKTASGTASSSANFIVKPGLAISPSVARPGQTVKLSAVGMGDSAAVDVYFDTTDVMLAAANPVGVVTQTLVVPAGTVSGNHLITLVARVSGRAAQKAVDVETNWASFSFSYKGNYVNSYEKMLDASTVPDLEDAWSAPTNTYGNDQPLVEVNGNVYVTTYNGGVFAYSKLGKLLWTGKLPSSFLNAVAPVAADGRLIVVDTAANRLYAYGLTCRTDKGQCTPLWGSAALPGGATVKGAPTLFNDVIYVPASDGRVYPVSPYSGAIGAGVSIWNPANGFGGIVSPVVFSPGSGVSYVSTSNGNYYVQRGPSLASETQQGSTAYGMGSKAVSPATFSASTIFVVVGDGTVNALRPGGWLKSINAAGCGNYLSVAPIVAGGYVYALCGTTLVGLRQSDGAVYWTVTLPYSATAMSYANRVLYVCSSNAITAYTYYGAVLWSGGRCGPQILVANETVYSAFTGLSAYQPRGMGEQLAKMRPQRLLPGDLKPDLSLQLVQSLDR